MSEESKDGVIKTEEQSGGENKIQKKFDENMKKLTGLYSGKLDKAKKKKLPNNEVGELINELLLERNKATKETFKTKAGEMIDKIVAFDKFKKEQQKLMDDAIQKKMDEMNKEMDSLFNIISSIDELKKTYESTLSKGI